MKVNNQRQGYAPVRSAMMNDTDQDRQGKGCRAFVGTPRRPGGNALWPVCGASPPISPLEPLGWAAGRTCAADRDAGWTSRAARRPYTIPTVLLIPEPGWWSSLSRSLGFRCAPRRD